MSSRIVIVDDDIDLVETLVRLLGRAGYTCLGASTGAEAIALMDSDSPSLVVSDLHMPGQDGLAVARHARDKRPPIPVVLMTAYPTRQTEQRADTLGGIIHVSKPFTNAHMLDVVRKALESTAR